jgi:ferrous iron transport protein B
MSIPVLALAGNPNCGKTTLFNALTGLRQKVANYPGVTVEKKTGRFRLSDTTIAEVVDLPGTYSLHATSPDEQVAMEVLRGQRADTPLPDLVIAVIDATNLARNLYLFSQLAELGRPLVVALTMTDIARARGDLVDAAVLAARLGVPVVPVRARTGEGLAALREALIDGGAVPVPLSLPPAGGDDPVETDIAARYAWIDTVVAAAVTRNPSPRPTLTERVDGVLVHRVWGLVMFTAIMAGLFLALFVVADPLMGAIESLFAGLGGLIGSHLGEGPLRSLLLDGVIAGVGGVMVFVPQIALLFLFLGILEDSGYLARAAFLMDRLLAGVGLHGRSFIPLLSSFACAIPGIMATRTISSPRERLATILIAPFMSCAARLPVYGLLIGAFFASWGALGKAGILLACYLLGIAVAAVVAWLATRLLGRSGPSSPFILELPTYQVPQVGAVTRTVWFNTWAFIRRAGSIIVAITILLWALAYYPRLPDAQAAAVSTSAVSAGHDPEQALAGAQLAHSAAGRLGHAIEPLIAPLGFDWKMGVGLVGAFAAREVFVATLGTVYGIGDPGDESAPLEQAMADDRRLDGTPVWTPAVAISLLVWFVIAMQCMSTLAIVRRETGGWTWPLAQLAGMNLLAWVMSFAAYRLALLVWP